MRTLYRWGWVPLVGGCAFIAAVVIVGWEIALACLDKVVSDPFLRVAFILRAVVTSTLLALWAGWYILRSRRRIEAFREQLRARQAELEERERRAEEQAGLGAMSRALAHEIRAPLNGIALHGTLLHKLADGLPEGQCTQVRQLASTIEEETSRLDRLLHDYMEYGKDSVARLERSPVDLASLVRAVIRAQRAAIEAKGLEVVVDLPAELPTVHADAVRVRHAVQILLRNAVEGSPAGGKVQVVARADGDGVRLTVEDDGLGVDDPTAIFRPFFITKAGASGLGFAIVRDVMRAHGGEVTATRSSSQGGALIGIRLPVGQA